MECTVLCRFRLRFSSTTLTDMGSAGAEGCTRCAMHPRKDRNLTQNTTCCTPCTLLCGRQRQGPANGNGAFAAHATALKSLCTHS